MELEIISPEKVIYTGEVTSVILPGTLGQFEVQPKHAAIISSLKEGNITFKTSEGEKTISIDSGFAEVHADKVSICVEKVKGL